MQRIYEQLRERILTIELPPGAALDEHVLEAQFNVSRTPVREALIRLSGENLVELIPNRGARVALIDFSEVGEMFEALTLLQRFTTRLAAIRHEPRDLDRLRAISREFDTASQKQDTLRMSDANRAFHSHIGVIAKNQFVRESLDRLLDRTLRLANISLSNAANTDESYRSYFRHVVGEHDELIELIAKRQASEADALASSHARLFQARVAAFILNNQADIVPIDMT